MKHAAHRLWAGVALALVGNSQAVAAYALGLNFDTKAIGGALVGTGLMLIVSGAFSTEETT